MRTSRTVPRRVRNQIGSQRRSGWRLVLLSTLVFVGIAVSFPSWLMAHAWAAFLPAIGFMLGARRLRQSSARTHGIAVEAGRGATLRRVLEGAGYHVERNVPLPGAGDIDMRATPGAQGEAQAWIIEIKSFRHWDHGAREKHALTQVWNQMHRSGVHRAVIWLPDALAHRTFECSGGVTVVADDERAVLKALRR